MGKGKRAAPALPAKAPTQPKRARFENHPVATKSKQLKPPPTAPVPAAPTPKTDFKGKDKIKEPKAPAPVPSTPNAPRTFIVSAGSYERLLYGLSCNFVPANVSASPTTSTEALPYELAINPIFSFPAHLSSLRTVSASTLVSTTTGSERKVGGKYLVTGGTDEVVKVWDLKRRKEHGTLDGDATGTITCLKFVPARNMLLVATTDSSIALYRVRDWVYLRALKGHKGRVNSIDAHPAGRVALSVGQDKMLRMWDLVAGKAVATLKIGEEGDVVRWNTDGSKFAIICNSTLTLYALDMTVLRTLSAPSRFHDVRFCFFPIDAADPTQREYMFVACEDGKTRTFDISSSTAEANEEPIALLGGHSNRVKMLDLLEVAYPLSAAPTSKDATIVLTSISSDGKINLYDLSGLGNAAQTDTKILLPAASYDSDGSRLTCVCAVGLIEEKEKDVGRQDEEEDSESGSGSGSEAEDDEESGSDDELVFQEDEELEFGQSEEDDDQEE